MKNHVTCLALIGMVLICSIAAAEQKSDEEIRTGRLVKRVLVDGEDNYADAAFSFTCGGNGPEIQKLCKNNWEILFGNGPERDSFDVTMVVDDRSRIKVLGQFAWDEVFEVLELTPYENLEREPGVNAKEGQMYIVHSKDTHTDLYTLFRVEKLVPGESVEITWKRISPPVGRMMWSIDSY